MGLSLLFLTLIPEWLHFIQCESRCFIFYQHQIVDILLFLVFRSYIKYSACIIIKGDQSDRKVSYFLYLRTKKKHSIRMGSKWSANIYPCYFQYTLCKIYWCTKKKYFHQVYSIWKMKQVLYFSSWCCKTYRKFYLCIGCCPCVRIDRVINNSSWKIL